MEFSNGICDKGRHQSRLQVILFSPAAWQGVNMVTQKQFQKAVDHIRNMRFHSSLDYSEEVSRDTCEELLKDVLKMLKIEVEK